MLVGVPLAFLAVFFVWPVVAIIATGLRPDSGWDLSPFADVVTDRGLRATAWFTLWQAAASTIVTLAVAMPGAYVVARFDFPGRGLLRAAITVPFVLPTVVVASAFMALVGPRGPLGDRLDLSGTIGVILAAHAFFNSAVVVRTVGGLWSHLDPRLEDAARMLGAGRWRAFREVTLPLLRPAITAATSIVFLFTFTSFGVVRILGENRYATLEVEIVRTTRDLFDLPTASALAVVQLVAVVALLVVYGRLVERRSVHQRLRPVAEATRRPSTRGERALLLGNLAVMALLLGTPLVVLAERSFRVGDGYGFGWYRALSTSAGTVLFVPPWEAVRNSLVYALAATALALAVGGCAALALARPAGGRGLDTLLMLPLGTSAVTVGFGFLVALDDPPLDLRASVALVPIAHAIVGIPFVVRTLTPVLRSIDPRLREAAAVLGASPVRVRREVDLPIAARAGLVAAGFAFAVSLGEFGATLLLARSARPTVPVAIFRFLGQPGPAQFGQAMAMSTILMVMTAAVILAVERFRVGEFGEF
ncbi:MAG: ABC transporter permease [Acidimicrobiales bacterium]